MPTARPDDVPGDPDSLQVHLSPDQPAGPHAAYLRDYYCNNPTAVSESRVCLDMCNEYIELTVGECWVCGVGGQVAGEHACPNHDASGMR